MKKALLLLVVCSLFFFQTFAEDYLLVKFKRATDIADKTVVANNIVINFHDARLKQLFTNIRVREYEKEFPSAYRFDTTIRPAKNLRLFFRVRILAEDVKSLAVLINNINSLRSADLDTVYVAHDVSPLSGGSPNDYYNILHSINDPEAWMHLSLVNAKGAWHVTTGNPCIKIGITDVNFQHHEDLDANVETTPNTAYTATANSNPSHGIEVAGMAGAVMNNWIGVSSLGYNIRLGFYDAGYDGIVSAIGDGCKVINCSWGWYSNSTTLQSPPLDWDNIQDLAKMYEVTIVAAAGNNDPIASSNGPETYVYPASYDGAISVTSVGSQWEPDDPNFLANWKDCHQIFFDPNHPDYGHTHQHNDRVDLCAPGHWVSVVSFDNYYRHDGGTSLSSPMVAAAAALLYSINPNFTRDEVEEYLKTNATDIYGVWNNQDYYPYLGAGRLNAGASLQAAATNAALTNQYNHIDWFGDDIGNPINPNEYWNFSTVLLQVPQLEECDNPELVEWMVIWGNETRFYQGYTIYVDLQNDFTQLTYAERRCVYPDLEVYVRHRSCANECFYSPYYSEIGTADECDPEDDPLLRMAQPIVKDLQPIIKSSRPTVKNIRPSIKKTFKNVQLFPSPASTFINVNLPIKEKQVSFANNYSIYNSTGALMQQGRISAGMNKLDISSLPRGLYFFKTNDLNSQGIKFIKQ